MPPPTAAPTSDAATHGSERRRMPPPTAASASDAATRGSPRREDDETTKARRNNPGGPSCGEVVRRSVVAQRYVVGVAQAVVVELVTVGRVVEP